MSGIALRGIRTVALILFATALAGAAFASKEEGINAYVEEDWGKAVREFRKAIESDPRDAQAHMYLGMSYQKMGRLEDAIDAMKTAIDYANPEDARAIKFILVNVLFNARRPGDVLKLVAELESPNDDNSMRILRARMEAQALEDLGRNDQARVVYERILGMLSVLPPDDYIERHAECPAGMPISQLARFGA